MPTFDVVFKDPATGAVQLKQAIEAATEDAAIKKARAFLKPRASIAHWSPEVERKYKPSPVLGHRDRALF